MTIKLLGVPQRVVNGASENLPLKRSYWLLFYLAYRHDWVRRDDLALFLRPDLEREGASLYLRQLLLDLRRIPWMVGLQVETEQLRWQVETDVASFRAAASAGRWHEAISYYKGPFLTGLNAGFLPAYESWLESERAALAQIWRDAMLSYTEDLEASGQVRDAAKASRELYESDNLDEEALHSYLRNAYNSGQRHQALEVADAFVNRVRDETGLEPTEATRSLIGAISLGQTLPPKQGNTRHGRRRSDRILQGEAGDLTRELLATVQLPHTRLLAVNTLDERRANLILTTPAVDIHVALDVAVGLAESLIARDKAHRHRAFELLLHVWNHPKTKTEVKRRVAHLFGELGADVNLL